MRLLATTIFLVLAGTGHDAAANPCTNWPPPIGLLDVKVNPPGGAVPTNARFTVTYDYSLVTVPFRLALLDAAGAAVDLDVVEGPGWIPGVHSTMTYYLTPRAPLAPTASYSLVDTLRVQRDCAGTPPTMLCEGEPLPIAAFTTGSGPDTAPPTTTGASVETTYAAPAPEWCSPIASITHSVTVAGLADEQPASTLRFNVYDVSGRRFRRLVPWVIYSHDCPAAADAVDEVVVRAVDIAGNEAEPRTVRGRSCASFEGDGGGDDDGGEDDGGGDGGGCSAGGGGLLTGGGGLVLLVAVRRRQRRRGPGRGA
jgi:uncharacterized membrane protein YgcG